ncbi:GNAT family N-acetyltransferase [Natronorubrum daqingense]|uniref:GNAT family N-acetyltransferase n=1 Tax=Natronorubrum daqingense TaxID=588898 RepID=A0A1N7F344_9EURY|nr:GNAT family N-acetyltransferase [Natronorubrum daqingense]APX97504.1 GNAT family N-acetyltransferase [Natronorubrum daqingense]SIR94783.1 Ribosomal protein S18 acetylase RimI [Natronorubrum daqingense]
MEIRPATVDDYEAIRTVARATWHETYDELEGETIDETVDDWYGDERLEEALSKPGTAFLVAETADEGVVGFTHGVVSEAEGDVLRMSVHPDHQGEGIGTALHDRLRADLEDFNMERMQAIDLASNDGGQRFYEKQGFERTGEGTVEIGGEERQEVVYTLEL